MNDTTMNISNESVAAACVASRLAQLTNEQMANLFDVEATDSLAVANTEKKKRKTKADKEAEAEQKRKERELAEQIKFNDKLESIGANFCIDIEFQAHSIKYKEQDWPIPDRKVTYVFRKCADKNSARNAARMFDGSDASLKRAENGNDLYFNIITDIEAIPYMFRNLGCVRVNENLKTAVKLASNTYDGNILNFSKAQRTIQSKINDAIRELNDAEQ